MGSETGRYTFHIRSSDLDHRERASLSCLCNLLQEAAGLHAHELGAALEHLQAEGLSWFLSRLHLEVGRLPGWRDAVTVETWPADLSRLYAIRDFRMADEGGEILARASTAWLLMDLERRKPLLRFPKHIRAFHPESPVRALEADPPRLEKVGEPSCGHRFHVRLSDLDVNGHVNNVVYAAQLAQAVPEAVWRTHRIAELTLEFKAECHLGDEIAVRSEVRDGAVYGHSLVREHDGREVARGRSRWAQS